MAYTPVNGTIEYEVEKGIGWVKLNQPANRNTIDGRMQHDLVELWGQINDDDAVRVVIVTGNGDCFSDGRDVEPDPRAGRGELDWLATYAHQQPEDLEGAGLGPAADTYGLVPLGIPDRTRGRPSKPLILAVHGACSGPALEMVAFADFTIASDDAEFFDPRVNVGDAPVDMTTAMVHLGALRRLSTLRLAYEGESFKLSAQRAYDLGMVVEVTSREALLDRARELAGQMLEASPAALRAVVAAYWDTVNIPYGQARLIAGLHGQQARTIDGKEGHIAWADGRAPEWPSSTGWGLPWVPFRLKTTE